MESVVKRGDLLIASASLVDPNFVRAVVLICEHSDEGGTFGLVLNRPISVPAEVRKALPFTLHRMYQGGPVRPDAMQVIHPYGDRVPQAHEVLPGIWLGGDFDVLCRGFGAGEMSPDACRFCLGYSGWGGGQLAAEFEQDAWRVVPASSELVLHTPVERIWACAVRAFGLQHAVFRAFPDDPSYN